MNENDVFRLVRLEERLDPIISELEHELNRVKTATFEDCIDIIRKQPSMKKDLKDKLNGATNLEDHICVYKQFLLTCDLDERSLTKALTSVNTQRRRFELMGELLVSDHGDFGEEIRRGASMVFVWPPETVPPHDYVFCVESFSWMWRLIAKKEERYAKDERALLSLEKKLNRAKSSEKCLDIHSRIPRGNDLRIKALERALDMASSIGVCMEVYRLAPVRSGVRSKAIEKIESFLLDMANSFVGCMLVSKICSYESAIRIKCFEKALGMNNLSREECIIPYYAVPFGSVVGKKALERASTSQVL